MHVEDRRGQTYLRTASGATASVMAIPPGFDFSA